MYNPQLETFLCVVECGSFNVEPAPLCRVGNFKGTYLCGGVHSSPAGGKRQSHCSESVWRKIYDDASGMEPLCRFATR